MNLLENLPFLTSQIIDAVSKAGAFIREEMGKVKHEEIEVKAQNSLVSYVDQNAEKMLVEALSKIIPDSGFITEEDTKDDQEKEAIWIIDPLDGTTNFLHAIPHFSTSVALQYKGELVIGVVYNIMADEMYEAYKRGGARMNGKAIQVDKETDFSECILATGFPYDTQYNKEPYFKMMEVIMTHARGMRRFGSAALDMAPWDVAGGIVICEEAGAKITDYFGTNTFRSGRSIIVANPTITEKIQAYTTQFFDPNELATS